MTAFLYKVCKSESHCHDESELVLFYGLASENAGTSCTQILFQIKLGLLQPLSTWLHICCVTCTCQPLPGRERAGLSHWRAAVFAAVPQDTRCHLTPLTSWGPDSRGPPSSCAGRLGPGCQLCGVLQRPPPVRLPGLFTLLLCEGFYKFLSFFLAHPKLVSSTSS